MNLVAPAIVRRYGKGTDSDATDAMVVDSRSGSGVAVSPTLDKRAKDGPRRDQGGPLIPTSAAIRRLTPTECERLQALPDGWTTPTGPSLLGAMNGPRFDAEPFDPKPDGPRYAACGDAVTANVAEWIGRRLRSHCELAGI